MSNRAWERRRRNKRVRLLRKRIGKAFDVSDLLRFVNDDLGVSIYPRQRQMLDHLWHDYLLPQRIGMMVMSPREFIEIKYVP